MNYLGESLKLHAEKVETIDNLSLAYTQGVAEPCRKINENKERYIIKLK